MLMVGVCVFIGLCKRYASPRNREKKRMILYVVSLLVVVACFGVWMREHISYISPRRQNKFAMGVHSETTLLYSNRRPHCHVSQAGADAWVCPATVEGIAPLLEQQFTGHV